MARWLVLLVLPTLGCIPYVFPSFVMTPAVPVGAERDEVHAFRVDISTKSGMPIYSQEVYAVREIPLIAGTVPPQVQAGVDHGIIIIGPLSYHFHYHDGVHVRLYRPGYRTVGFKSFRAGSSLTWVPTQDAAGREQAIDDVIGSPGTVRSLRDRSSETEKSGWQVPDNLVPGSHALEQRRTLSFVALEYERLAARDDLGVTAEMRERLLDKASKVRRLARNHLVWPPPDTELQVEFRPSPSTKPTSAARD